MSALTQLIIAELPSVIETMRGLVRKRDPAAPLPTDEQVMAAFEAAFASSRSRDEQWLAAHPEPPPAA